MTEPTSYDTQEERDDIYGKTKNTFDFLASVVDDENVSHVHRIRAAKTLSSLAKTLRCYILDEEKLAELEKRLEKLEKTVGITKDHNKQQ